MRQPMKRTTSKPGKDTSGKTRKSSQGVAKSRRLLKGAPFGVDAASDGDIVSPRHELSEDDIKEHEDRRS